MRLHSLFQLQEKTPESLLDCREIKTVNSKGNQEINPEYSLERLMLKLKLQYFWPPDAKNWLVGKDPDAGKDWRWEEKGMRGWDGWMASLTQWTWVWAGSGSWWTGKPSMLQCMGSQTWTPLRDWAELNFQLLHNWIWRKWQCMTSKAGS